jgi:hypothetical protein
MSFSMNQAKNWFRWATDKKRITRAKGAAGPVFRTMGRRGLVGNVGQATAEEIAQAVYEEDLALEEARRQQADANARANGWSPTMMTSKVKRAPAQVNSNRVSTAAHNLPMTFTQAGIYGGKSRRTRKVHKRSRRARTHRR